MRSRTTSSTTAWGLLLSVGLCAGAAIAQKGPTSQDKYRAEMMLKDVENDLKDDYYDPSFHGIDIDARFNEAKQKLGSATSVGQEFGIVAQAMLDFDDSHTFFLPPQRAARTEYGWTMQMVGDRCFVIAVKPGSDAQKVGLKPGDAVEAVNGMQPVRENLWKLDYLYYDLRPQPSLKLRVRSPGAETRELVVNAKVTKGKNVLDLTDEEEGGDFWRVVRETERAEHLTDASSFETGEGVLIWNLREFNLDPSEVDRVIDKSRKHESLILDLRGNPGGSVESLRRMLGGLFDHEVKIGDMKERKKTKPLVTKTRKDPFKGKVIVLVDSKSASASEILARVLQLEKRGTVLGDRTAGAVMVSKVHGHQVGTDTAVFFAASITEADLIMGDGKSLEKVGVTPDETMLATPEDLAAGRDTVLSRAAERLGAKLDPVKAGAMFPIRWRS